MGPQAQASVQSINHLHGCAYQPLHKYIQYILPYLEQRQEAAKILMHAKEDSQYKETAEGYESFIKHCNKEIMERLNIIPENEHYY